MKNARQLISQNKLKKEQIQKHFKYEVIESSLHDKFDRNEEKDLVLLKNAEDSKQFIVDYNLLEQLDVERYIADNKIKEVIQQINKNKTNNERLILFNVESPQLLENIVEKQAIIEIEI